MNSLEIMELDQKYVANTYARFPVALVDGRGAELCCHFCGAKYFFDTDAVVKLLAEAEKR